MELSSARINRRLEVVVWVLLLAAVLVLTWLVRGWAWFQCGGWAFFGDQPDPDLACLSRRRWQSVVPAIVYVMAFAARLVAANRAQNSS